MGLVGGLTDQNDLFSKCSCTGLFFFLKELLPKKTCALKECVVLAFDMSVPVSGKKGGKSTGEFDKVKTFWFIF